MAMRSPFQLVFLLLGTGSRKSCASLSRNIYPFVDPDNEVVLAIM